MGVRVNFEIGKLLREKGFDKTTDMCFDGMGSKW